MGVTTTDFTEVPYFTLNSGRIRVEGELLLLCGSIRSDRGFTPTGCSECAARTGNNQSPLPGNFLGSRDLDDLALRLHPYACRNCETCEALYEQTGGHRECPVFNQTGRKKMSDTKKLVVVVTNGFNDERSSVAWSVANGGVASGYKVTMFLVSSGADWARKGAAELARPNPLDPPIKDMMQNIMNNGGTIMVCPPCAKVRGYEKEDLIDGAVLAGSVAMLGVVSEGASTLTF
jgi:predicted peroxiredoxin